MDGPCGSPARDVIAALVNTLKNGREAGCRFPPFLSFPRIRAPHGKPWLVRERGCSAGSFFARCCSAGLPHRSTRRAWRARRFRRAAG
ncbi:hypothetical protein ERY430_70415 [Erythrobacter sp. EC-HK427]|nr:hypothetical protein ERY430_70415 [Erythrobacter sp. EC-HK427]